MCAAARGFEQFPLSRCVSCRRSHLRPLCLLPKYCTVHICSTLTEVSTDDGNIHSRAEMMLLLRLPASRRWRPMNLRRPRVSHLMQPLLPATREPLPRHLARLLCLLSLLNCFRHPRHLWQSRHPPMQRQAQRHLPGQCRPVPKTPTL